MNMLSPFWPQHSGLFGAARPVIDATGGQYEGLQLSRSGQVFADRRCGDSAGRVAVEVGLAPTGAVAARWSSFWTALTLFALSPQIYFGHTWCCLSASSRGIRCLVQFRPSGRAFWLVGYTLVLGRHSESNVVPAAAGVRDPADRADKPAAHRHGTIACRCPGLFRGAQSGNRPQLILCQGAIWLTMVPVCSHPGRAPKSPGNCVWVPYGQACGCVTCGSRVAALV